MKTYIFGCIFFMLILSNKADAQEKPFLFGMKISPQIGWMNPNAEGYDNDGIKAGISWGFVTQFHVMENYDIHSGINISILRSSLIYPDLKAVGEINQTGELHRLYNLKYLGVPAVFRMKTNEFSKKRFFGQFGLELNFLLSAHSNDKFNTESSGQINAENDIYNEIKFARYALIAGVGMEYSIGGSNVLITGINFNNGINDVLKDQNKVNPDIQQIAINNFVELYLSLLF